MVLNTNLDFILHLKNVNETIELLRKLQNTLSRTSLTTIFKLFIRPHLDYEDIIYDRVHNTPFHQNIQLIQYYFSNYRRSKRNFLTKTLSRVRL